MIIYYNLYRYVTYLGLLYLTLQTDDRGNCDDNSRT